MSGMHPHSEDDSRVYYRYANENWQQSLPAYRPQNPPVYGAPHYAQYIPAPAFQPQYYQQYPHYSWNFPQHHTLQPTMRLPPLQVMPQSPAPAQRIPAVYSPYPPIQQIKQICSETPSEYSASPSMTPGSVMDHGLNSVSDTPLYTDDNDSDMNEDEPTILNPLQSPTTTQLLVWKFLFNCVMDKSMDHIIHWTGVTENGLEFRIQTQHRDLLAKKWGRLRNKPRMTLDSMFRGIRCNYNKTDKKTGIVKPGRINHSIHGEGVYQFEKPVFQEMARMCGLYSIEPIRRYAEQTPERLRRQQIARAAQKNYRTYIKQSPSP